MAKQIRLKDRVMKIESCDKCPLLCGAIQNGETCEGCFDMPYNDEGICIKCPLEDVE